MPRHLILSPIIPVSREELIVKPNWTSPQRLSCPCQAIVTGLLIRLAQKHRRGDASEPALLHIMEVGNDNRLTKSRRSGDTSRIAYRYFDLYAACDIVLSFS